MPIAKKNASFVVAAVRAHRDKPPLRSVKFAHSRLPADLPERRTAWDLITLCIYFAASVVYPRFVIVRCALGAHSYGVLQQL